MNESGWSGKLGRFGIWSHELRYGDARASGKAAAELEALGFGTLWIPGGVGGDILPAMDRLLDATKRTVIASAIVNVWKHEPEEIAGWWHGQDEERRSRILLGLGISHGPLIGEGYGRPLAVMGDYVDRLRALDVPADHLCIAALAPKMMELAGRRTAGAHPYLVTPGHTAWARGVLGDGPLLAPAQSVVLDTDPDRARAAAREDLSIYMSLPNYLASWKRQGFADADLEKQSDAFCDAIVAWGEPAEVAPRIRAHLDAGADHVCVKLVRGSAGGDADACLPQWRRIATALNG